jgi:SAM-dependent methyltransferase
MSVAWSERDNHDAPAVRTCPQCGGGRRLPLSRYSFEPWQIVQCADCGFVYLENAPSYDRLVSEFAYEKTAVMEKERRKADRPVLVWLHNKTRWRLKIFGSREINMFRRIFAPGRLLDVGCGLGLTIPEPYIPFGIEVSEVLARQSNASMEQRGGRAIHAPAIEGLAQFPDCFFTGILLRGFLEHEIQPKMLLRQITRLLADAGAVYVKTPNYGGINRRVLGTSWCGFRYPEHVNYFTVGSLRKMAADCGLRLELLNAPYLLLDDSIKAVLRKS